MSDTPSAGRSLLAALRRIPDHRGRHGRRHPLAAILGLICCAVVAGARGLRATSQWGRQHAADVAGDLGFTRRPPCAATIHNTMKDIDAAQFEAAIVAWIRGTAPDPDSIAIDGKTLRATRDGELPGVHLLAAYAGQIDAVLAQTRVDGKTNEAKTILGLLEGIPLDGVTVTMDAAFTQREVCEAVIHKGGDYIVAVKDNQPTLRQTIEDMFSIERSPL